MSILLGVGNYNHLEYLCYKTFDETFTYTRCEPPLSHKIEYTLGNASASSGGSLKLHINNLAEEIDHM